MAGAGVAAHDFYVGHRPNLLPHVLRIFGIASVCEFVLGAIQTL
jgi:hypothetical protein